MPLKFQTHFIGQVVSNKVVCLITEGHSHSSFLGHGGGDSA